MLTSLDDDGTVVVSNVRRKKLKNDKYKIN